MDDSIVAAEVAVAENQRQQEEVLAALSDVKARISHYDRQRLHSGITTEHGEYGRAHETRRTLGIRHHKLMAEGAALRQRVRALRAAPKVREPGEGVKARERRLTSFNAHFVNYAKERLPSELFDELVAQADRRSRIDADSTRQAASGSALGVNASSGGMKIRRSAPKGGAK